MKKPSRVVGLFILSLLVLLGISLLLRRPAREGASLEVSSKTEAGTIAVSEPQIVAQRPSESPITHESLTESHTFDSIFPTWKSPRLLPIPPKRSEFPQNQLTRTFEPDAKKEAMPDQPDEALKWRMLQLVDENGFIPHNALINAWEQTKQMPVNPSAWPAQEQSQNSPPGKNDNITLEVAGIQPTGWSWLGPGNIGGRIRSIIVHPTDPQTMWVGSVSGGIWKSTNGGTSWFILDDFMANLAVGCMAIDPTNPNVLYAGTGEGFFPYDSIRGAGIFKTTNGGTTWTQLSSTSSSSWYYINRLAINPINGQIILAATNTGIWRSTDGGTTWSQKTTTSMLDINFNPTDGNKCIASGAGARYSTDGGLTWNTATGVPTSGRIEVAYSRSDPSVVYASANVNSGEVYRSTNGGQTYTLVNTGTNYLGNQGWYDNIIWVDPTNSNIVIVGGIDLWRSTNGGTNLTKISQWFSAPQSAHADQHIVVESPQFNGTTNKTVFFGNDGGIYRTSDVYAVSLTTGWTELNNNLGITQFYGGAGNPTSGRILGGTQDNGTLRYTGGTETWTTPFGGDGGWCAADPTDPNYFYGEYVYLRIHRSTNGGQSSNYIYQGLTDAEPDPGNANFIAPFILDPNNPNTLLAGGNSLWRSTNAKAATPSWTSIKNSGGTNISAIAVAKGNSNVIWVGHNNGDVYFTTNGTSAAPTWTRADTNSPGLPNRYCTRITIDPTNSGKVYVTFGGFNPGNVWRTDNSGSSWSNITSNLPSAPVRTLAVWQQNPSNLYVGTEVGIFASANGGQSWSPSNDGPTNCSVDELFWMNDTLVAATHGRGMFSIPITAGGSCTYALSPTSRSFSSASNSSFVNVSAGSTCPWTATVNAPSQPEMSLSWKEENSFSLTSVLNSQTTIAPDAPQAVFLNSPPITINDRSSDSNPPGIGSLYPSTINVSGMTGTITVVQAALNGVSHTFPDDIDVVLVGPGGQRVVLMSDVGGTLDLAGVDLIFEQSAAAMPDSTQVVSGTYRPTNFTGNTTLEPGGVDNFPSPGPGQSVYASDLNVFNGTSPNGAWKLYVVDDQHFDSGNIASGWALGILTSGGGTTWINITSGSSGTGNGTVNYSVAANSGTSQRTGTITVNGQVHTVTQAGTGGGCPPTSISVGQTRNGSLASSDCVVSGTNRYYDVYSFSGVAGQGIAASMDSSGFDTYLYLTNSANQILDEDNNSGPGTNSRIPDSSAFFTLPATGSYFLWASSATDNATGAYSVGLSQCTYSISSSDNEVGPGNGAATFLMDAPSGCNWSAVSDSPWLTTSSSGPGDGSVTYNFMANPSTSPRTGHITVGGQIHTVTQIGLGGAGRVQFSSTTYPANEGGGIATITVTRTGGTGTGTVNYSTSNGTATAGIDYTPASGLLLFTGSVTSLTFSVTILDDTAFEGNETINLLLSSHSNSFTLGNPSTATLTIVDNEIPPLITVTAQTNPVGRTFTVDGTNYSTTQIFSWTPGSNHTLSTTSPQSGATGTRYVWSGWSDGGAISHNVAPTSNTTYTANFTTQYFLTMNAGTGGTVSPPSNWFNSGQGVSLSAAATSGFSFSGWTGTGSGSFTGSTNPANVTMSGPITETASFTQNPIQVTVQPNPAGRTFTVDGTNYSTTQIFSWTPGSNHTLSTTSPQSGATGTRYLWSSWSDGGAISHNVSPSSNTTYTANFTTQYFLTMNAGTGGTVSPPSNWFNSGQGVSLSAAATSGFSFSGWTGTGSGSFTGSTNPANVTMSGPITETASFTQNPIQVTVQPNPAGRTFTVDGTNYSTTQIFSWTPGSNHTLSTTSPQSGATGTRYLWSSWSDGGAISHNVSPSSNTTYTANFTTQYFLTMNAGTGGTVSPPSNWFNSGQGVSISASPISGFNFNGWTGSGSGSFSGSTNPAAVTMNGPITETASFTPNASQASYDSVLKAPKCGQPGNVCDSETLLNGRDNMSSGPESNQPNTINSSCVDGIFGTYHTDESVERIKVSTLDGTSFAAGKTVKIEVTVWAWDDPAQDHLDLYYAADAGNPNWIYVTTLAPSIAGAQVLSATYILPSGGSLQAVRAVFRFQGAASPCGSNSGFDDHDDLIFAIGSAPQPLQLLLEEFGPSSSQAAALDSMLFLRDPFPVVNGANVFNLGLDRNTRVIIYAMNLQPASGVVVNLVDVNGFSQDIAAEDVRPLANLSFTQVIFRLPNNLAVGTCTIKIKAPDGRVSNSGTIRIRL